jgi:hypothetical protein
MPYMYLYYNNALLALRAFGFLLTVYLKIKVTIPKKRLHFSFYSHPSSSLSFPSSFILSYPLFVCSVFLPVLFSPSLSLISPHPLHMCSIASLSSRHILYLLSSLSVNTCFPWHSLFPMLLRSLFRNLSLFSPF